MMTGIVVSNSILIVEFSGIFHEQGMPLLEATVQACKVRLRLILMTSLATLLGMVPMALGLEVGSGVSHCRHSHLGQARYQRLDDRGPNRRWPAASVGLEEREGQP